MRIVHVVRQFYPAIGGFESVVWELATRQAGDGHTVRVITLDRLFKTDKAAKLAARETIAGIEIIRIPFVGSSRYPIAPAALKHIGDSDIVHVHAIDFFFDFLAWTKPLHHKKLVVSTHGGFFHTSFAARLKQIYFATVTRVSMVWYDGVAAVSTIDQSQFSRIRARGLVCIENGVNISKFTDAASRHPVKSMIWIGRFSDNKRLDRLILFLAALLRRDADWRLTIAGQPWDLDVRQLHGLAHACCVRDALTIVESPEDAEIRKLIGSCSIIVSCSEYEGFGIAAIEGMSAGLFPLLSKIAPFERLIANSGVGLNMNFDEADGAAAAFSERWQEAAEDYSSSRKKSMAAASRHSWEHVSQRYQSFYDDVLGAKRRTILDVPVFVGTRAEAVDKIDAEYDKASSTIVAFANANALNVASSDDRFCAVLKRCLVMNDGVRVVVERHVVTLEERVQVGLLGGTERACGPARHRSRHCRLPVLLQEYAEQLSNILSWKLFRGRRTCGREADRDLRRPAPDRRLSEWLLPCRRHGGNPGQDYRITGRRRAGGHGQPDAGDVACRKSRGHWLPPGLRRRRTIRFSRRRRLARAAVGARGATGMAVSAVARARAAMASLPARQSGVSDAGAWSVVVRSEGVVHCESQGPYRKGQKALFLLMPIISWARPKGVLTERYNCFVFCSDGATV